MTLQLSELGLLIFVSALVAMLSRRLHMPYTVGLVLAGIGLNVLPFHLHLQLSKELIFTVFLPPLVFEAALHIRWRDLRTDLPVVIMLATLGLVLAAAVTAIGMHYAVAWGWGSAWVFGVLIAATDPVSVVTTFREAGVRGRLRLLVEAESLLNDGTAAVAFVVAVSIAAGLPSTFVDVGGTLFLSVGGGIISGAVAGFGMLFLAGRTLDPLVEITFTTLAAYGSFLALKTMLGQTLTPRGR
jgi:CPA1 family monovalent cation:H+ antiporter